MNCNFQPKKIANTLLNLHFEKIQTAIKILSNHKLKEASLYILKLLNDFILIVIRIIIIIIIIIIIPVAQLLPVRSARKRHVWFGGLGGASPLLLLAGS